MSGICGAHQGHDSTCAACNVVPVEYQFIPQVVWCVTHQRLDDSNASPAGGCDVRSVFFGNHQPREDPDHQHPYDESTPTTEGTAMTENERNMSDAERVIILAKRIELMLLEAGATIEGDAWHPVFVRIGDSQERLS